MGRERVTPRVYSSAYQDAKGPRNPVEARLWDLLLSDGWECRRKGWPDIIAFKNGRIICVEVKPKRSHNLKRVQYKVLLALSEYGVPCYRWTPDGGFEGITPAVPHLK